MVRKCIVPNCTSSDITILSHRFPRNKKLATKWQEILNVEHTSINDLFSKHVVCTKHFKKSDYRNPVSNHLNSTALPSCDLEEAEESVYEIVELLEEVEQSSTEDCEEDEEHLEYTNVNDEHSDDNGSNIETNTDGRETIDLSMEEVEELDDNTIEMNLIEENTEMIEEPFTNQKQNNFIEEQPCKKRKLDSPIGIQESEVTQEMKLPEIEKAEIPEIEKAEIDQPVEIKSKITEDDEISDDEDSNFKKLSRNELIKKIKSQSKKITELEKKIKSYQKKMNVSMKTIKQLMLGNSDDDDNDDDFI